MSYLDKKFGELFPTRTGDATGTANERQMLDAIGGSDSFRTRIQEDSATGQKTMCRTKNGMPQFSTTTASQPQTQVYMESGQLTYTTPGEENPSNSDVALWRFLDIPTTNKYLGKIATDELHLGEQQNKPALSEAMDSLAIGYPRGATPAADTVSKEAYSAATIIKKFTAKAFPASLFTGKLRLFIQAQYGAKETVVDTGFRVDLSGSSTVLKYAYSGVEITFGLWAHQSPGLFTAPDKTFWLLTISGGPGYGVTAYPVKQTGGGKVLMQRYKADQYDPEDREKLEAYIFAHSYIDTTNATFVGSFDGVAGFTLAYGWKWNTSGDEARIVVHNEIGPGTTLSMSWYATTLTLGISYSAGNFALESGVTAGGEWTDGWGRFNIFAPEQELGSRLACQSIAMDTLMCKPAFSFSNVPVYGYYKDDVWTPVVLSRNISPGGTGYSQWNTGLIIGTEFVSEENNYQRAVVPGNATSWHYESQDLTSRMVMNIAVGGWEFIGEERIGHFTEIIGWSAGAGSSYVSGVGGAATAQYFTGGDNYSGSIPMPTGYSAMNAALANAEFTDVAKGSGVGTTQSRFQENWSGTGARYNNWVLVIPGGDAEAVYVPTRKLNIVSSGYVHHTTTISVVSGSQQGGLTTSYAATSNAPGKGFNSYTWTPYQAAQISQISAGAPTPTDDPRNPLDEYDLQVTCFNSALSAVQGVQGGSYTMLFNVDSAYPFYDRGMYFRTSAGKRYAGSEIPFFPESINVNSPFVGWV